MFKAGRKVLRGTSRGAEVTIPAPDTLDETLPRIDVGYNWNDAVSFRAA